MKIKKPSLKGMNNTKYLGHFAEDKYIQQGHNDSGTILPIKYKNGLRGPDKRSKELAEVYRSVNEANEKDPTIVNTKQLSQIYKEHPYAKERIEDSLLESYRNMKSGKKFNEETGEWE